MTVLPSAAFWPPAGLGGNDQPGCDRAAVLVDVLVGEVLRFQGGFGIGTALLVKARDHSQRRAGAHVQGNGAARRHHGPGGRRGAHDQPVLVQRARSGPAGRCPRKPCWLSAALAWATVSPLTAGTLMSVGVPHQSAFRPMKNTSTARTARRTTKREAHQPARERRPPLGAPRPGRSGPGRRSPSRPGPGSRGWRKSGHSRCSTGEGRSSPW